MNQPGEPSVEDILESIKLVIARETPGVGVRAPRAPGLAERSAAPREEADVLDLSLAGRAVEPAPADVPDAALVAPEASASMRDSLAALAMLAEPGARPRIVRSGETSLEELARDLLRPALAEWLDNHLPPMVERMVAAEIARIVGKKG